MRPLLPLIILLTAGALPMALAEDGGNPQAPVSPETQAAMLRTTAEAKAASGRQALQLYRRDPRTNPMAVVDAALAFAEAQRLYHQIGDSDGLAEMQANLFWCRRQMDQADTDAIHRYLAERGRGGALDALAAADRPVDGGEAQGYFERAKAFADAHPSDLNAISIRYFEVAMRFPGTPPAVEAQKLSLAAQTRYLEELMAGANRRDTLFSRPAAVGDGAAAIPDDKAQRAILVELRKLYAKPYALRGDPAKRRLAAKLVEDAAANKGDAPTYFTMLNEACRLAQESEDYPRLLAAIDLLAAGFAGYPALDQKRLWLRRSSGRPVAVAVTTLLDQPDDAAANLAAGRFFCFTLLRWSDGLPLLTRGGDADLKTLAGQELAGPATDDQRVQLAEGWYAQGRKGTSSAADRLVMLGRAQYWYLAAKDLAGLAKERVAQRLAELDRTLPLDYDSLDWNALTPSQWDKLKGVVATIPARVERSGPLANLRANERVRVVPHPTDAWTCQAGATRVTSTAGGKADAVGDDGEVLGGPFTGQPFGALVLRVGTGEVLPAAGVFSGPGPLWAMPNRGNGEHKGQIRVKLLPVEDE